METIIYADVSKAVLMIYCYCLPFPVLFQTSVQGNVKGLNGHKSVIPKGKSCVNPAITSSKSSREPGRREQPQGTLWQV